MRSWFVISNLPTADGLTSLSTGLGPTCFWALRFRERLIFRADHGDGLLHVLAHVLFGVAHVTAGQPDTLRAAIPMAPQPGAVALKPMET